MFSQDYKMPRIDRKKIVAAFEDYFDNFPSCSEDDHEEEVDLLLSSDGPDEVDILYDYEFDSDVSQYEDNDSDMEEMEWKKTKFDEKHIPEFDGVNIEPVENLQFSQNSTPLEFFQQFFNDEVMDMIVTETNRYALQTKTKNWEPVSKMEMYSFFGMLVLMGVHQLPVVDLYWSSNPLFYVEPIATNMTSKRFKKILSNLHLNNNDNMPDHTDPNRDKLFKIRPLLDKLNKLFGSTAVGTFCQSIDESMILFKGRSSMKQFMPNKPKIKRGFKVWSRCDSKTGYLYQFDVYTGKSTTLPDGGLAAAVVLALCEDIKNQLVHVTFDNFYTSYHLMEELLSDGTYSTGTVRSNRKDLPIIAKNKRNDMKKGDLKWRVKKNVGFVQWMDSKKVNVLSTAFNPKSVTTVSRKQKNGKAILINCPSSVAQYTKRMGGVDRFDQKQAIYTIGRRSKRWWLRIFHFFLNAAVTNSYILHNSIQRSAMELTHFKFRVELGTQLMALKSARPEKIVRPLFKRKKKRLSVNKSGVPDDIRRHDVGSHMPVELPTPRRCYLCSTKDHNKRSRIQCSSCKVPLCVVPCFVDFHMQ